MNFRKWLGLILLLVLPFVLVACGGGDDDDSGDEGDGGSDVDLSQSISAEDPELGLSLSVDYPEGWVAQEETGVILIANTQEMMDIAQAGGSEAPDLENDQVFLSVQPLPDEFVSFVLEEGEEATAAAVLSAAFLGNFGEGFEVSEIEDLTFNGNDAAAASASSSDEGRVYAVAIDVEGGYVGVIAVTAPDEGDFDDEVQAIAGSVEATFPAAEGGDDTEMDDTEMDEEPEATEEG